MSAATDPQPLPNLYDADPMLRALLVRAPWVSDDDRARLGDFGAWVADVVEPQADFTSRRAPPVLETQDVDGRAVSVVRHNPLYDAAHREVYARGIVGLNYGPSPRPFALTFAMGYMLSQSDISIHCPVTLTGAVAYVLDRFAPAAVKEPALHDLTRMDGKAKTGGTWATEKHGGSDVGGTTSTARPTNHGVAITGLKWFASNVDGGYALATARPPGAPDGTAGLGLYLIPAAMPDGTPNRYRIRRLKEKLGTRGLATGEIELHEAHAIEVAPPPEGFKMMMAALGYSRIHNAMASAGVLRRALHEAASYAAVRPAFGHMLDAHPMVQDQLLTLLVRHEAGTALAWASALAFDAVQSDPADEPWSRITTALAKYLTAEWAIESASTAIEILGGNGYTEEYATARLLRDAQVLTVWEGPPNIQAHELLRLVAGRYPGYDALAARVHAICDAAPGPLAPGAASLRASLDRCGQAIALIRDEPRQGPRLARRLLDLMARTLAGALLLEHATADLAAGDARRALLALAFIGREIERTDGLGAAPTLAERHVPALLAHEAIAPTTLAARTT